MKNQYFDYNAVASYLDSCCDTCSFQMQIELKFFTRTLMKIAIDHDHKLPFNDPMVFSLPRPFFDNYSEHIRIILEKAGYGKNNITIDLVEDNMFIKIEPLET